MLISTILRALILLFVLLIPSAGLALNDSLAIQGCTCYYNNPGNCETVVKAIQDNYSFDYTKASYIELGDPSKPAIVFLHGWPDSPMEWINQMEYFCMPPNGRFYCIAPAMPNFISHIPNAPSSELHFHMVVERFAALAMDLHLKNVTWAIHDWGVFVGIWIAYKYPALVGRIAVFDIGNICIECTTDVTYQYINNIAFLTQNTSMTRDIAESYWGVPCPEIAVWRTAWPYADIMAGNGSAWVLGMFGGSYPYNLVWKYSFTPDMHFCPMIFFWGNMTQGAPRTADTIFFSSEWLTYVESTPFGEVVEVATDHWIPSRAAALTNIAMDNWLMRQNIGISTKEPTSSPTETGSSQRVNSIPKCIIYVILMVCCAFW